MPVLSCPKCPTKLKVPDGVSGNTRCPKCGTVFPVVKPAFEVVGEAPNPPPKSAVTQKPAPAPAAKPQPPEPDFEVVGEPKTRRPLDDDDDDDDDRPRSRKRRSRYDDDDDDDRPRKKKKKKRYTDDEDDWQPMPGRGDELAKGRTGALLIGISFWLNLAAFGLLTLYSLIMWVLVSGSSSSSSSSRGGGSGGDDGSFFELLVILPGLIGLGAWIVGLVGCSIAIAGPRKARGMAITATVFAAIHLILVAVTFSNLQDGLGVARGLPVVGKVAWIVVASTLPALDTFLPMLFYQSKAIGGDYVIAVLAAACECARLIFLLFTLKALALAARDYDASEKSGFGVMIVSGIMLVVALVALLVAIVLQEGKFRSMNTYANLGFLTIFLMYLGYTLMMIFPATAAMATKDACDRRA